MPATITSRANPRVKHLRSLLANPRPTTEIALEGDHLLTEAIRSNLPLRTVFLTPDHPTPPNLPPETELLHLTPDLFASISATRSPQGIAALLDTPSFTLAQTLTKPALLLVLDALQDPGNLGTLLRSAEAFGATGCLLLPGTASPWSGKALRASAGSALRLPTVPITLPELATLPVELLAAVGKGPAQTPDQLDLKRPTAILLGNEGAGLSPAALALAHARITLRTTGPVESLNAAVAGSLLLYSAQQQRTKA